MVQYLSAPIDHSFAALSDATRRGILERLRRQNASISDLAESFDMSLTGMKKHIAVLESAGLVSTEKVGRVRTCKLGHHDFAAEIAWLEEHRRLWAARFDGLERVVEELKNRERADENT
jgi:DNA-binding transcriptional ArsR family regulator